MPKVKSSKAKSSAAPMDEADDSRKLKKDVATSSGRGSSAVPGAAAGIWDEEVAAAEAASKRADIEAAIAKAPSAREKRKLRLQLIMKQQESEKAKSAKPSALGGSGGALSTGGAKAASTAVVSPFAELLSALPSAAPPAALARPETALAAVTSAFTVRTGKVSRARPDVAAVAQFTAIAGLPSFAAAPLKLLQQQIKATTRKEKDKGKGK